MSPIPSMVLQESLSVMVQGDNVPYEMQELSQGIKRTRSKEGVREALSSSTRSLCLGTR
jgi:hypothetical protein